MDKNNELSVKHQSESVNHEVKDLRAVAKERNILFVVVVKKVKGDVNLKIEEIRQEMTKEVAKVDHSYLNLHTEVDIVANVVMKLV